VERRRDQVGRAETGQSLELAVAVGRLQQVVLHLGDDLVGVVGMDAVEAVTQLDEVRRDQRPAAKYLRFVVHLPATLHTLRRKYFAAGL
jgi:hypothetical protein